MVIEAAIIKLMKVNHTMKLNLVVQKI